MARKMKDSGIEWIGEIPEGWETCLYKYCCSVQPGYPFDSANFSNSSTDGFPLIRIRDITSGEIQTYYTGEYPPNYIVTAGDLLVGMDGDFNVRWWNNDAALLNQRCCRVTEKDSVLRRFLYYVLPFTLQHINTLTYATTVKHLANGDILNSFIAFPSLPAQQNIVHYLDTVCSEIDAMLSKTRSSIEEYKKLKQAVITQAVTKGVRGEREMKDSGVEWIGEIPKAWAVQKIKSISSRINVGVVIRPSEYFDENGTVPFLRGINVKEYVISSDSMVYINESSNRLLSKSQVHTDDILIVRDGSIGTSCVVPAEYDGANVVSMVIVTPSISCDSRFICYSLNSDVGKTQFTLTKIGSALTHTSVSAVSDIIVAVPSCAKQKEIADYLDAKCAEIDKLIAKKEQLVKELESYKKSLIYEVVTGKREV